MSEVRYMYPANEISTWTVGFYLFWERVQQGKFPYIREELQSTDVEAEVGLKLLDGMTLLRKVTDDDLDWNVLVCNETRDLLIFLRYVPGSQQFRWTIAAHDPALAQQWSEKFFGAFPSIEYNEPNIVPINFWSLDPQGSPRPVMRKIGISPWDDIKINYPAKMHQPLSDLLAVREPDSGGKLILMHSVPGTGKTWFLRSLAWHWRDWCKIDYIVDPEEMFERAYYMMHMLLAANAGPEGESKRWQLLVVEDAGKFLTKNNHERGMDRLLNLTDGLIGQGLKFLVLMTTNEPILDLHEAVSRPGRCLSKIAFETFKRSEAVEWLSVRNPDAKLPALGQDFTLADLYEIAGMNHIDKPKTPLATNGSYL